MTTLLSGDTRLEARDGVLQVSGDVGFTAATELASAGREWLGQQGASTPVSFDLSRVEQASSAALSVVLEWLRCARQQRLTIEAVRLSVPLSRLTSMTGLAGLLSGDEISGGEPA